MSKVCVIGIDGGTFEVIDYLVGKGRLPNFREVLGEGSHATLLSTVPALTPAAWTTFYTGSNPGQHGAIDFFKRIPGTYNLMPANGGMVRGTSLWSQASRHGKRVCVYNVPMTYPAEPQNGIIISGMDAPRLDERAIYPRSFREKLLAEFPDFEIEHTANVPHLVNNSSDATGQFIQEHQKYLMMQIDVMRYLMQLEDWDLFVSVIRSPDTFQHAFWRDVERVMDNEDVTAQQKMKAESVFACYEAIDRELGRIRLAWENHNLVMLSDHGFGRLYKEVCLNRALAAGGLLKFRKKGMKQRGKDAILSGLVPRIPKPVRQTLKRTLSIKREHMFMDLYVDDIDWEQTRIYALSQFGTLYVNRTDREPLGQVSGEKERRAVIAEAEAVLSELTDPDDGMPVVTAFHHREELFHGPLIDEMPSMVVGMRDCSYRGVFGTKAELSRQPLVRKPYPEWKELSPTGCHRRDGILMLSGPDVARGSLDPVEMVDVAPTILTLMGLPVPGHYDGDILEEVMAAPRLRLAMTDTAVDSLSPAAAGGMSYIYSDKDEEEVRKRLKELGYL